MVRLIGYNGYNGLAADKIIGNKKPFERLFDFPYLLPGTPRAGSLSKGFYYGGL
jgi:hypothetical protein